MTDNNYGGWDTIRKVYVSGLSDLPIDEEEEDDDSDDGAVANNLDAYVKAVTELDRAAAFACYEWRKMQNPDTANEGYMKSAMDDLDRQRFRVHMILWQAAVPS